MSKFDRLEHELAYWHEAGLTPRLWLRDDDAIEPTPALDRLITHCRRYKTPVLLAIIAGNAKPELAERLADQALVIPCQHGYIHKNHAAAGERAVELGGQRPLAKVEAELSAGQRHLAQLFGSALAPILVPPWNRIDPLLPERLPGLGFSVLSTFGRKRFSGLAALRELNCHVDLIDWRGGRSGKSLQRIADELAEAFETARGEGGGPIGLLGHHLAHDEQAWDTLQLIYDWLGARQVEFADPRQL